MNHVGNFILICFGILMVKQGSASTIERRCFSLASSVPAETCIYLDKESHNPNILYYFHGIFGDKTSWEQDGLQIREIWEQAKKDPPTVVSISFGQVWLLNDKNSSRQSGKLEVVLNEVLPMIEAQLNAQTSRELRYLFGVSMGGFNVIQMVASRPELFKRVVLACPAITTITPFASKEEIDAYTKRNHAEPDSVQLSLRVARAHFPDIETWNLASPLLISERIPLGISPKIFVTAVENDKYGFQEGDVAFSRMLQQRGIDLELSYNQGRHCEFKPLEVAGFLDIL
jgi:hypothetical protein